MSSGMAKSPIGGGGSRRVIERHSLGLISVEGVVKRENMTARGDVGSNATSSLSMCQPLLSTTPLIS